MGCELSDMSKRKKTFNFVLQYFGKDTVDTFGKLHHELVNARPRDFKSLLSFWGRIIYLKERLEKSDFKMTDKAYTWLALQAIASEYPDIHTRCMGRILCDSDTLTWDGFMLVLQAQALREWLNTDTE